MFSAGEPEIHVIVGAGIEDRGIGLAERDRLTEFLLKQAEAGKKQRSNTILERKALEITGQARRCLPTIGKDQRFASFKRRICLRTGRLVEQLHADEFLERLITLRLVVHDLRSVALAVRTFL